MPAVNAGACQGKSVGMPPSEISATGNRASPLIAIQPKVVASLTPIVAALRMKYACTPQATQIRIASGSHGPDEPSDAALVMLNSTIAASAATRPTAASVLMRSRSRTIAITTVIAGEIETIGKIRYAGPMVSA